MLAEELSWPRHDGQRRRRPHYGHERRPAGGKGLWRRGDRAGVRGVRRRARRHRGNGPRVGRLLDRQAPRRAVLRRRSQRPRPARTGGVDPVWRRPGAVGRNVRRFRSAALPLGGQPAVDVRLVPPRDRIAGGHKGAEHPDGGAARRGAQSHGRYVDKHARRRDHEFAPVRRRRCRGVGRRMVRPRVRLPQDREALLLARHPRARRVELAAGGARRVREPAERPSGDRADRGALGDRPAVFGIDAPERGQLPPAARGARGAVPAAARRRHRGVFENEPGCGARDRGATRSPGASSRVSWRFASAR